MSAREKSDILAGSAAATNIIKALRDAGADDKHLRLILSDPEMAKRLVEVLKGDNFSPNERASSLSHSFRRVTQAMMKHRVPFSISIQFDTGYYDPSEQDVGDLERVIRMMTNHSIPFRTLVGSKFSFGSDLAGKVASELCDLIDSHKVEIGGEKEVRFVVVG